jgi:RNA polymerase sigma-70 factor (ECF subfamily)
MAFDKATARSIEQLVKKAQKGDTGAFGQVYDHLVLPIYRYVYYRVARGEVEDLTELIFLKAWENIGRYKKQRKNTFGTWVFRIAHNVVVDYYRTRTRAETVELSENLLCERRESDPAGAVQLKFEQRELSIALRRLPPIQQQVVVLKFINGLSNAEIASIINKSEGAIRVIQYRSLEKLKKLLTQKMGKSCNKSAVFPFEIVDNG